MDFSDLSDDNRLEVYSSDPRRARFSAGNDELVVSDAVRMSSSATLFSPVLLVENRRCGEVGLDPEGDTSGGARLSSSSNGRWPGLVSSDGEASISRIGDE